MTILRRAGVLFGIPLLLACETLPPPANPLMLQQTGQVIHVSPEGWDFQDGSAQAPLRTLAAAAARVRPGSTVMLAPGTYREALVTQVAGTAENPIVFKALDGKAVIDGSQLPWRPGSNQNQGLVELRHPHVRLEGLTITSSPNTGLLLAADHLTVAGCEVSHSQLHAISTETGFQEAAGGRMIRDVTLTGNDVHHAPLKGVGSGQAISLIADGFRVVGNTVHHNPAEGIDLWLGARNGEVVDNVVHDNGRPGIYVDGATRLRIHRNRIHSNKDGIGVSSEDPRYETQDVWVANNLIYDHDDAGCFVWDPDEGVWDVVFAHNTLVDNQQSFQFSGRDLAVEVTNNLGVSREEAVKDGSQDSYLTFSQNLWLRNLKGFVNAPGKDFRLLASSPAIDKGKVLPVAKAERDWGGGVETDFSGAVRSDGKPDVGAFEFPR